MLSACQEAINAQPTLDLDALIEQMQKIKGKPLSKAEQEYLGCLICGYTGYEMAFRRRYKRNPKLAEDFGQKEIYQKSKTITSDTASRFIRDVLKEILNLDLKQERLPSGEHLIACLKAAGFEKETSPSLEDKDRQILNIMLQIPPEVILSPQQRRQAIKLLEEILPGKCIGFFQSLEIKE
ncbi:MAG: hypothetical protein J7524_17635 [Roseofilum sp. Belize BBD 4]|uniref:hypothetical protein n=1 Tax=Roseofilum sp. Belize BBD 4 TaxID=2821500 RepID=UPI000E91CE7F|nr:hypothetical protein [Roseofilum sp. Belize BBD 4]MBP0034965.1 hypothetical protein [Roseofilum sp. Belize BBD 4]HBQ98752.1 hypothetical protein [Cyanobacteria bacterium UBA11691]